VFFQCVGVCVRVFLRLLCDTPAPGTMRHREAPKEKEKKKKKKLKTSNQTKIEIKALEYPNTKGKWNSKS